MNKYTLSGRAILIGAMVAGLMAAEGCHRKAKAGGGGQQVNRAAARGELTLDGQFNDWPVGVATIADPDWIYFHVTIEGNAAPIQASAETLELWLDADASTKTGIVMPAPPEARGLGVDLVVTYSPPDPEHPGQTALGVQATAAEGGASTPLTKEQIGLSSLPTFASPEYEVRISRHINAAAARALSREMAMKGTGRGMFVLKNASGKIVGWSDPETFKKAAASRHPPQSDATVPAKKAGTVRVATYNVLKSALTKNPPIFARVFQVLDADVVVCQEWDTDAATASSWFTAAVTGQHPWYARTGPDVAIVSPFEIQPLGPDTVIYQGAEKPVRFAAGLVKTPAGDVVIGTAHLKCCGTAGSAEDQQRLAEAQAINGAMKSALATLGTPVRGVIGGDLNLVGSSAPLGTLAGGLDADGSDLSVVQATVLGDPTMVTWMDAGQPFPPGRLDYLLVGDAGATVVDAFVLDTRTLSAKSLARMGLDAQDSAASDHMPVVVDIKTK